MFGLISKALGGSRHEAQAMALREIVEMSGANPRKVYYLCVGEDFLARFNCDHGFKFPQTLEKGSSYEWEPGEPAAPDSRALVLRERAVF
jgi:hypothetical protein